MSDSTRPSTELLQTLSAIVGPQGLLTGDAVLARPAAWRSPQGCAAAAILRPATTAEVSQLLASCHAAYQPLVTQGGLTGLVHGSVAAPHEIVLSTERLNRIERVDAANRSLTTQAGVPLQRVQDEAQRQGLLFPLDLGARGSCTIGGNIATNAGGNRVIRYGMMRELVLGLEAVLADGTVLTSMNRMLKNNAGYDLKQLFIGTEGTLGVVTRAVLRLRELPLSTQTALLACASLDDVLRLLRHCDSQLGGSMCSFEVLWNDYYRLTTTPPAANRPIFPQSHPFYVILESQGSDAHGDGERFEHLLSELLDGGRLTEAMVAASEAQRAAIWGLRENLNGALQPGRSLSFDVSLSLTEMASYVDEVYARVAADLPGWRCLTVGHLGDGNLHFLITGGDPVAAKDAIERCVYEPLQTRGGSISGEHGIGSDKLGWLPISRSAAEIALMRQLKQALDPRGILNPGRVVALGGAADAAPSH